MIGRTKGGMNTKLHAICDSQGRPINLFVTAGQVSDYIGARALVSSLPDAEWLLGDRGYDADWFREALEDKGIRACIPGRKQRKTPVKYDKRRYKRRNRTEIMFGRLKDWRRFATRYDRCPKVFLSAIALAATVIFWLCVLTLSFAYAQHSKTAPPDAGRAVSLTFVVNSELYPALRGFALAGVNLAAGFAGARVEIGVE
ncbi:IS5 family transposase [Tritonibacter scottomollicae]|uniref:IS5 family transposase n=1 Tax=Tritonibacter scottomollicae TaxID=483013 RepID=UPI002942B118|nr:IS5 family transposase [Tritonibacter scottomollicae]